MKFQDPLLERWGEIHRERGPEPAVFDPAGGVLRTFAAIEQQAQAFAPKLESFHAGEVLAIQIGNHPDWPSLLLACLRQGIVVLPLETTITEEHKKQALEISGARGVIIAGQSLEIRPSPTEPTPVWEGSPPSLLKLTSGTTAAPRAIRFHSAQLLADCDNICVTMGITADDLNYGVIPVSHSYGFSNLLTPLLARGVSLVMTSDRLPRAIVDGLVASRATVFPGMPVFYQALCEMQELPRFESLRLCISAGAPLPGALAQRFKDRTGQAIHSFYGSSECGGICYDREGTRCEDGYVGPPMENVRLEAVDPAAESTLIRVHSAAVADGYFPEPDENKLGNGTFAPDDLLAGVGDGYKIVGRISDLINVAGKKVNPAEIEAQLLAFDGVRQAIAFGRQSSRRNEEVAACVVADAHVNEADLLKFCRARLSGWQVPKKIFVLDQLPINERGKTSRRELALKFACSKQA